MRVARFAAAVLLLSVAARAQDWVDEPAKRESFKQRQAPVQSGAVSDPSALPGMGEAAAPVAPAVVEAVPEPVQEVAPAPVAEEMPAPAAFVDRSLKSGVYDVREGDTLWGIAGSFYQNPFSWTQIWNANKAVIENPDLIFPNQQFRIPDAGSFVAVPAPVVSKMPGAAEAAPVRSPEAVSAVETASATGKDAPMAAAAAGSLASVPPAMLPPSFARAAESFNSREDGGTIVREDSWKGEGCVLGAQDPDQMLMSGGDVAYVDLGVEKGARPNMRGAVYRRGDRLYDPKTGDLLGVAVRKIGTFRLTSEVGDQVSTARILSSRDAIQRGDIVEFDK